MEVLGQAYAAGMLGMLVTMLVICTTSANAKKMPWAKRLEVTAIAVAIWPFATYKMMSTIVRIYGR